MCIRDRNQGLDKAAFCGFDPTRAALYTLCEQKNIDVYKRQVPEDGEAPHPIYFVHVCGAVVNPGVYEMEPGSRIYEAVDLAGGFGPEAAWSYLNLAQEIADGKMCIRDRPGL